MKWDPMRGEVEHETCVRPSCVAGDVPGSSGPPERVWPIYFMRWVTRLEPAGNKTQIAQDLACKAKFGPPEGRP
jgi:hypothetical protein